MNAVTLFAEVVVHSPLGRGAHSANPGTIPAGTGLRQTFHYSIPPHWQGHVLPGQLVWVPFGPRQLPGIVVATSTSAPVSATRDILGIIDLQPVLTPYQIELMHWISSYYYAPLHAVAWSMFPSGISWQAETMLHLEEATAPATTPSKEECRILALLREHGPLSKKVAERQLKMPAFGRVLGRMVIKGWVRREIEVRAPQVKPKTELVVHLSTTLDEQALNSLSRAPKQRAVLEYLRQQAMQAGDAAATEISLSELLTQFGTTRTIVDNLAKRGLLTIGQRELRRNPLAGRQFATTTPPHFTLDQESAWQPILQALESARGQVFLLHGVTGSGKTEIYLRALDEVLKRGGQGIVLVPEIALTPQTIRRFAARFPNRLAVLHSQLSDGERYDEWRRIRNGQADVVIGPRSAIFAPLPRLRLIVLDEEHEWSYKQQDLPPLYHARDVAIKLAKLTGALVILGSATPDICTYYRAQRGEYTLLRLPQRIMGHQHSIAQQSQELGLTTCPEQVKTLGPGLEDARYMDLPRVDIVDLRAELHAGNRSIFSRVLQDALRATLAAHQQAILFLNRRGAASFVMCRDCGHVVRCTRCAVPLTFHAESKSLVCHHCNRRFEVPTACPQCDSSRIRFFGIGTEKVVEAVHALLPQARVLRWDRDVTSGKNAHEEILDQFMRHQADVLVGTQMIAKGLDLPLVTLAGVITADTALQLPDFRAGERTFQLLTQVAGRAGRSILGGQAIVQTYAPQHYCIQAASRHDYDSFYQQEIEFRRQQRYPPFSRLVRLLLTDPNAQRCEQKAQRLGRTLANHITRNGIPDVDCIGPAPCFIARIRGQYRWQLVLRGIDPTAALDGVPIPQGWHVDVDPSSLL